MQEVFKRLNQKIQKEEFKTELLTNPKNYIGGTMIECHRIFFFSTNQIDNLYIDFKPYKIESDKIFIIPSGHILYLPAVTFDFFCLNIDNSSLNEFEKLLLFRYKYLIDKSTTFSTDLPNLFTIENVFFQMYKGNDFLKEIQIPIQYIHQAEKLNTFILNTTICHQLTVTDFSKSINVSPKTLLRICKDIFNKKPQYIIRYHLIVKAIFFIIANKTSSLSFISDNLNFKDLGTFSRYVKAYTGISPNEIRKDYLHLIIRTIAPPILLLKIRNFFINISNLHLMDSI